MAFDSTTIRWFTRCIRVVAAAAIVSIPAMAVSPTLRAEVMPAASDGSDGPTAVPYGPAQLDGPGQLGLPGGAAPWLQEMRQIAVRQLGAALAHAYRTHAPQARPLPDEVKRFLAPLFPESLLARARYVVSAEEITLPGILNQGNRALFGQDHAVTIDHVTVFSRDVGLERASDAHWWAHELAHHIQYQELGSIEAFAAAYVSDFYQLEQQAEVWGKAGARKYIDERVLGKTWQRPAELATGVEVAHEDIPEGEKQRRDKRTDDEAVEPEKGEPAQGR